jgi:hypothetical protein
MGQNISSESSSIKIREIDHVRVEITNMGDEKVLISYHGVEKEIKQGESIIVLKIVLDSMKARVVK